MRRISTALSLCLLTGIGALASSPAAWAKSGNPLEGQPAVRHRYEVRAKRFEIGPMMAISLDGWLRHTILIGAKVEYHINDYFSAGFEGGAGMGFNTGFAGEIASRYDNKNEWKDLEDRFSRIKFAGDVRLAFTPFHGKIAIFKSLFMTYDFYAFAGLGLALTGNNTNPKGENDNPDQTNEGFRLGPALGLGMRLYIKKFMALGFEVKDLMFADNLSGQDLTRGLSDSEGGNSILINGDDKSFLQHFFFGLTYTFFLPTSTAISE